MTSEAYKWVSYFFFFLATSTEFYFITHPTHQIWLTVVPFMKLKSHLKQVRIRSLFFFLSFMGRVVELDCTLFCNCRFISYWGPLLYVVAPFFLKEKEQVWTDNSVYFALNSYCHGVLVCLYHLISIYADRNRRFGGKTWYYLVKMKNLFFF